MSSVSKLETLEKYWSAERREVPRDEGERGEVVYVNRVGWESIPGRKFVESVRGSPQNVFEDLFGQIGAGNSLGKRFVGGVQHGGKKDGFVAMLTRKDSSCMYQCA